MPFQERTFFHLWFRINFLLIVLLWLPGVNVAVSFVIIISLSQLSLPTSTSLQNFLYCCEILMRNLCHTFYSYFHFLLNLFSSSVYTPYALSDGNHMSSPSILALQPLLSMNSMSFLVELQGAGVPYCHHLRSAPLAEKGIREKPTINAISAFFIQVLCT